MTAAAVGTVDVVEYLCELPDRKRQEKIEALELIGASLTDQGDMSAAYDFMKQAMEERYKDPVKMIEKVITLPVPAYDNTCRKECQTLNELENIRHDHVALHMESLKIRERIQGDS